MNKYPKEFLMRVAEKVEDPLVKLYILYMNSLLEYDFEYLKKSKVVSNDLFSAVRAIAEVTKNYDYVKEVFDLMIDDVKRRGEYSEYFRLIEETISTLIKEDKDKYEEHILNKLFGNAWKDPDFFLPRNHFLGLSDRLPTLGDLLFHNTTFSDNISEELSKKIIKGLKLLYDAIPELMKKNFYYAKESAFPDCPVSKYIKQDLKLGYPYKIENDIEVEVMKDYILVAKRIYLNVKSSEDQVYLSKKIEQCFYKTLKISITAHGQDITLSRGERINLPANFSL